jgi:hypothetical protein
MLRNRYLLAAACCCVLGLTTCTRNDPEDSQANFFVAVASSGYTPQGYGWKPNSKVSIDMWGEPDGPGSASTAWKHLFDVNVDSIGMFGFTGAQTYPVPLKKFCGNPENGQTAVFMAKSLTTGRLVMRSFPVDIYFTFHPCG